MLHLISFALPLNFGWARRSSWSARLSVTTAPNNNGPVASKYSVRLPLILGELGELML